MIPAIIAGAGALLAGAALLSSSDSNDKKKEDINVDKIRAGLGKLEDDIREFEMDAEQYRRNHK